MKILIGTLIVLVVLILISFIINWVKEKRYYNKELKKIKEERREIEARLFNS